MIWMPVGVEAKVLTPICVPRPRIAGSEGWRSSVAEGSHSGLAGHLSGPIPADGRANATGMGVDAFRFSVQRPPSARINLIHQP